jgi:hypothetical protein
MVVLFSSVYWMGRMVEADGPTEVC